MKKTIIAAISAMAFAGFAFASSSVSTPTCSLSVSPSQIPLGVQTPVNAQWTVSGATAVSVVWQHTGANGPVTDYSSPLASGNAAPQVLGSLTNYVTVTATNAQGSAVCKATVYGYSNRQP